MPNFIPLSALTPDNPGATTMTAHTPTVFESGRAHRRHNRVASAVAAIPLITVLAACGGGSSGTPAAQATSPSTSTAPNGTQGSPGVFPGATGLIAAASPGTLQVQSSTAQNTVVYTASTKFTQVTSAHLAAGDCVTVTGAPATGSTSGLAATSVRIVAKVNGVCPSAATPGGGAFGGAPGGGGSFPRRTGGASSGAPTDGSAQRRDFASATGTVSSVTGSTILVHGVLRSGQRAAGTTGSAAPTTITVTLGAAATVTETVAASSAAAVVGRCASVIGTANSVGAISARSITISTPGPNGCRGGFGGRFNGNGANGSGTGSASGTNA